MSIKLTGERSCRRRSFAPPSCYRKSNHSLFSRKLPKSSTWCTV